MTAAATSSTGVPQEPSGNRAPVRPTASLRAVALVSSLTGVQLAIQFAMQIVMARHFGAGREVDAYVAALTVPTVLSTILSASLGYVLVPAIATALRQNQPSAAAAIATQIGVGLATLSLLAGVLVAGLARPLTVALCPGFSQTEVELTAHLLQILSVLILTNALISFLNALYHALGQFARPAIAGVVGTGVTLGYLVLLHGQQGIFAIAWGMVAGSVAAVALMSPLAARQFDFAAVASLQLHAGTRRALALLTPLILGALYWRLDPLLDRYLASYLDAGRIAHMGYSWRLVSGLMLIGTSGLSIVAFPAIAAHAAAGRRDLLGAELAHALRFFLAMMIPLSAGISVFASPVVALLFEHGRFTPADTQAVAWLVVLYAGVILGAGLGDLFSRSCYAQQDMRTPVVVSIVAFTIAAGVKIAVVRPWGAAGLVAATSFYSLLNVFLLGGILLSRLSPAILCGTGGTTLRALIATAVASAAAMAALRLPIYWAVLPAAAVGALAYFLALRAMRDEFALQLERWLLRWPRA